MAEVEHEPVAEPLQQVSVIRWDDFFRCLEQEPAHPARGGELVPLHQPNRFDHVREDHRPCGVVQRIGGRVFGGALIALRTHRYSARIAKSSADRPIMMHRGGVRTSRRTQGDRCVEVLFPWGGTA